MSKRFLAKFGDSKEARRAYKSWCDQRERCRNPKNKYFDSYGGSNIKVLYSSESFVGWWLEEIKLFRGKTPTVGRKNHAGNYEFSNIELQDRKDNTNERNTRCGLPNLKPLIMADKATGVEIRRFSSLAECSAKLGFCKQQIGRFLKGKCLSRKDFILREAV